MMGIVVPETRSACKKYNKIISGILLVLILVLYLLKYKILIKLFVLNCVSEGCTSGACILSPSK